MRARWTGAFQIAAVYVGTVVGAGFATGREIAEFFTKYGFLGFVGIVIAGYIFIFTGSKMMILSSRAQARTYEEFNRYLFGKKLAPIVNIFFLVMLLGVTAVMISGAGAVFEEQLGLSRLIGVSVTILGASFILMLGLKGLFLVNSFVVPIMVFFSVMLCVLTIADGGVQSAMFFLPGKLTMDAVLSPFAYAAFNLALAQAILIPVAYEIKDEKVIREGSILGGVFLTLILLAGHISLLALPNVLSYEIPTAELMKKAAAGLYWVFILVIYSEIFTSVIGNIFGLQKQINAYIKLPNLLVTLLICTLSVIIGQFEYGTLLSYLYPIFGYISLLFLFLIWLAKLNKPMR